MAPQTAVGYPDPDLHLVERMAAGDVQALDELYALEGNAVLGFLITRLNNRQLAEEVLQDVMLAAWNNAPSFRGDSKVRTWLMVIARNRAINATRRKKLPMVQFDETFTLQSEDTGPVEKLERKSDHSAVREAIANLPEEQREVLVLVFYHQMTGPEVAEILGISHGTVKSRLHRAKAALKGILKQEGNF